MPGCRGRAGDRWLTASRASRPLRAAARADLCSEAHCTTGTSSQQYWAAVMFTHARPADKATTITIGAARSRSAWSTSDPCRHGPCPC
jgi:hypothetical protein